MNQETISQDQFNKLLNYYLKHPEEFAVDVFGVLPWSIQVQIIQSVFNYKYTAVKTCNAIGKSFIAAIIVVTFLMLHPSSIVVTTAPTWRQVTDVLWREIATAVKRAKYKLTEAEVTQAGLSIDTDWFAVGLSTKRPENFFGYHADHILVVVDEAGGVEEPIFKGVAAITPNTNARVLLIGNPTNPGGTFYDAFTKPELGYNTFSVSAFDTPNFTDTGIKDLETLLKTFTPPEGVKQADWNKQVNARLQKQMNPAYRGLIDPNVVYSRYHEWGVDSPAWESLIMGEFPSQADQALIPTSLVTMAMNMYGIDKETGKTYAELSGWNIPDGPPVHGQDMARFGSDLSVNYGRKGGWVEKPVTWAKTDLMRSADKILTLIDPYDDTLVLNIDDTGNGGGTTDRLHQMSRDSFESGQPAHRYTINAYNFSSKDFMTEEDRAKFYDITSMLYWNLRTQFYNKAIALHYDKELFDELVARRWSIVPGGKIKVESKDEYRKRTGGKSPDKSDALALSFAPATHGSWLDVPETKQPNKKFGQEPTITLRPTTPGIDTRY